MLNHKGFDKLEFLYKTFKRVKSILIFIINKMSSYIVKRGEAIVTDQTILKDPIEFTAKLLKLKKEMDEIVSGSFQNDIRF